MEKSEPRARPPDGTSRERRADPSVCGRSWFCDQSGPDGVFQRRPKRCSKPVGRQDWFCVHRGILLGELSREGVSLSILRTGMAGEVDIVRFKRESLTSLLGFELFGSLNIDQVLMISPN